MKKFYFKISTLIMLGCFIQATAIGQTYVNQAAAGANNGTSWANAYTDLQIALDNTASGAIWVAAATYKPGTDTTDMFSISSNVTLYGGFNGTETSLSQRNPTANQTILSGDLNNNDIVGNFTMNKSDNSEHVVYVDSLIAGVVTIDGFIIQGGHTLDDGDMPFFTRAGGGIFALSTLKIQRCTFRNNFARSGASVSITGDGSGSEVLDCNFTANFTTAQSAGVFASSVANFSVRRSSFTQNLTSRGAIYPLYCVGVTIDSCYFGENTNTTGFGGALFIWNNIDITLSNSAFHLNTSANAGAINYNGSELTPNPNNFLVTNCSFTENVATDFGGGAIWNSSGSFTMENCTFQDNIAANGGHVFQNAPENVIVFNEVEFIDGVSNGWGGGLTCYGLDANYFFESCYFEGNEAAQLGGAVNNGFAASSTFIDCVFEENSSLNSAGGALALQNDSTTISVIGCIFNNNSAGTVGGAIFSGAATSAGIVEIDGCEFWLNSSSDFGGAISVDDNGDDDISKLTLRNSLFGYNLGIGQGGAVNLIDSDATITSCLFFGNVASDGAGAGGAISINASDSNQVVVDIINSTFADNDGDLAAGIANWTGANEAVSNTNIQNCIFRHGGLINYAVEGGTPTLTSLGGNMSDDGSFTGILTHPKDIEFEDPDFVDPDDFDYSLEDGSLAVNAGVSAGAPTTDMLGNPRVGEVDMGSLENQTVVDVEETIIQNNGQLKIAPNPVVSGKLNAVMTNQWEGDLDARIFNVAGQAVSDFSVSKFGETSEINFDVSQLSKGMYDLIISNGTHAIVAKFVKM